MLISDWSSDVCSSDLGNAEDERRHQRPARLGMVGALRPDDAADVALAEVLVVAHGLLGHAIGDPVDDAAADAGKDAKRRAERRAADDQPLVAQRHADAVETAAGELRALGDLSSVRQ